MKYNININQLVLAETKLDIADCAILDWLIIMCNSMSSKIATRRRKGFTQIDYDFLIKEMPLLRIKSKGAITPRIKKIEQAGFIEVDRVKHQSNYIKLTEKVDELFTKLNRAVHETEQKAVHETEPIIILNNNHYTKSEKDDDISGLEINKLIDLFKVVNPMWKRLYGNKTQRKALKCLVEELGLEKVESLINFLPKSNRHRFAPKITTPVELSAKLGSLIAWGESQKKAKEDEGSVAFK